MKLDNTLIEFLKHHMVARKGNTTVGGTIVPDATDAYNLGSSSRRFATIYTRNLVSESLVAGTVSMDKVDGFDAYSTPQPNALLALDAGSTFPTSVYPSALLVDGSRALTGNLAVNSGVTIDGVDISAHAGSTSIHHSSMSADEHSQYVHTTTARTITAVHTFTPGTATAPFILGANGQGQTVTGLRADQLNKTVTAGNGLTGGGALTANITLDVGAGTLITVAADTVSVANGTAQYQVPMTGATPFTPAWTALSTMAGAGLTFATGAFAVGAGTLITVAADTVGVANGTAQYQVMVTGATPFTPAYTALSSLTGAGLTFTGGQITLTTPGTLTATTTNSNSSNHTHAITAYSDMQANPGTLFKSDGSGNGKINTLTLHTKVITPLIESATTITLDAASDAVIIGPSNLLKSQNFASQTTGWGISYAGSADFRYIYADSMQVKAFIADLEMALAGSQIIAKSVAPLYSSFTIPTWNGVTTITVKSHPGYDTFAVFQNGDMVLLRDMDWSGSGLTVAMVWGTVVLDTTYGTSGFDSATQTQRYTFTRSGFPRGGTSGISGQVIGAGALVVDYGVSGNGVVQTTAIDGNMGEYAPYQQVVTWTTHPHDGQVVRTRLGNLKGLWGLDEYGLFAGDGIGLTSKFIRVSDQTIEFHNIPLNLFNSTLQTVAIQADGDLFMGNDISIAGGTSLVHVATAQTYNSESLVAGAVMMGNNSANKPNLLWDATNGLRLRTGTTDRIKFDTSGNAYIAGILAVDTAGEIRQGTGTLGSNYTGLRIWNDTSVGRIAGYNNNVQQWYAGTDGKLYAGAGVVLLDSGGITLSVGASFADKSHIKWVDSGVTKAIFGSFYSTNFSFSLLTNTHYTYIGYADDLGVLDLGFTIDAVENRILAFGTIRFDRVMSREYLQAVDTVYIGTDNVTFAATYNPGELYIFGGYGAYPGNAKITLESEYGSMYEQTKYVIDATRTAGLQINGGPLSLQYSIIKSTALGASVYRTTTYSHTSTGNWVAIPFDNEFDDSDTCHDNSTNNTRLTCKTAGVYIVTGSLVWDVNSTGIRGLRFRVNGTGEVYGSTTEPNNGANDNNMSSSAIIKLAVNDYIEMQGFQNSGGNLNVTSTIYPKFAMYRLV